MPPPSPTIWLPCTDSWRSYSVLKDIHHLDTSYGCIDYELIIKRNVIGTIRILMISLPLLALCVYFTPCSLLLFKVRLVVSCQGRLSKFQPRKLTMFAKRKAFKAVGSCTSLPQSPLVSRTGFISVYTLLGIQPNCVRHPPCVREWTFIALRRHYQSRT